MREGAENRTCVFTWAETGDLWGHKREDFLVAMLALRPKENMGPEKGRGQETYKLSSSQGPREEGTWEQQIGPGDLPQ